MYSTSPELGILNLSYPETSPKGPSVLCSQIEGPCTCHVHELTQMSNSGLSLECVFGHVRGHFRFTGLSWQWLHVIGLLSTKPLENLHTRFVNMAHFRGLELHLCRRMSHPQPGQRFPLGVEVGGMGTLARCCLLSLVIRPSQTADKCNFFSLFCLLCLFPFQKAPYFIW